MNRRVLNHLERMRKYRLYIETFIPKTSGGTLEDNFIKYDEETKTFQMGVGQPEEGSGGPSSSVWDENSQILSNAVEPFDSGHVYRVMPNKSIFTGRMLLHLIRWPAMFGASDEALLHIMLALCVPYEKFYQEGTIEDLIRPVNENSDLPGLEECLRYYHPGNKPFLHWLLAFCFAL